MAVKNRVCATCGKTYKFCPSCGEDALKPAWMVEYCTEDCKDIWEIATKFNLKVMTKEQARTEMLKIKLNPIDTYSDAVKQDIKNIIGNSITNKSVFENKNNKVR